MVTHGEKLCNVELRIIRVVEYNAPLGRDDLVGLSESFQRTIEVASLERPVDCFESRYEPRFDGLRRGGVDEQNVLKTRNS